MGLLLLLLQEAGLFGLDRPPYKVSTPNSITESVNDPATVNQTSEITRFLLHKEILLSGFTNFNDRVDTLYGGR
jgi:hypothetical protein